jgi:hypothetical protein
MGSALSYLAPYCIHRQPNLALASERGDNVVANFMKLRHANALVFVAWCLIMPPLSQDRQQVDKHAPLSRWDTISTYDTAATCRNELGKLTALIAGNIEYSVIQKRTLAGKCIAADDPRLHSDNFEMY